MLPCSTFSLYCCLITDSHTPTPTPDDAAAETTTPAPESASETSDLLGNEEGRGFAKRIVAEILDRSVAKYRSSLEGEVKATEEEEGSGGDLIGPKSNYVNFDIAQTVIVSSREAGREESEEPAPEEEARAEEREGSVTPTG